jgi:hypothetical protein
MRCDGGGVDAAELFDEPEVLQLTATVPARTAMTMDRRARVAAGVAFPE